jgi:PAS domain S-box-containing protein
MSKQEYVSVATDKDIWDKMLVCAFQNAHEAMILCDYRGKLVTVNGAALQLLGYTLSEIQKMSLHQIFRNNLDTEGKLAIPDLLNVNGNNIHCIKKDRNEFPVHVRMFSISTPKSVYALLFINGNTTPLIAGKTLQRRNNEIARLKELITQLKNQSERALRDRTQILQETVDSLVEVQKKLRISLKKETEANEKSSKFAYLISHEYRTPLTSILTSLNLIEKHGMHHQSLNQSQKMHLEKAKQQIGQLVSISEELLQMSTNANGYHKPRITRVNLTTLIEEICQHWEFIKDNDIQIRTFVPQQLQLETNTDLLKQVMNNVISNAIKYSDGKGEVLIECGEDGNFCVISVRDYGRGIPKLEIHKLSNGFYRATNATGVDGNGLGLFITRQFLEHLHGNLKLESELNFGTCVTIRLPKRYEEKSITD